MFLSFFFINNFLLLTYIPNYLAYENVSYKINNSFETWISYPPINPLDPVNTIFSYLNYSTPLEIYSKNKDILNACFITIGDWGTENEHQKSVADQMAVASEKINSQFIINLGDNFYDDGVYDVTDPKWDTSFKDFYSKPSLKNQTFYSILGNHDYRGNPYAQIAYHFYNFNSKRWFMPNYWYFQIINFNNVPVSLSANPFSGISKITDYTNPLKNQFDIETTNVKVFYVFLDTQLLTYNDPQDKLVPYILDSEKLFKIQLEQLEDILASAAGRADWIIVSGHYPILGYKKEKDIKILKDYLTPLFSKYHVDVYFNGHEHYLAAFNLDNTLIINNGGGGAHLKSGNCDRPECIYFEKVHGFTVHYLTKTKFYTGMVTKNGNVIYASEHEISQKPALPTGLTNIPLIKRVYVGPNPYYSSPSLKIWLFFIYGILFAFIMMIALYLLFAFYKLTKNKLFRRNTANLNRYHSVNYDIQNSN